jgi:hypothetical protein
MAVPLMANEVVLPQNQVMQNFAQGATTAQNVQVNQSNLLDAKRRRAQEDLGQIGSIGLALMGGKLDGQVDPAKYAELIPWAKAQGIDISAITPEMIPEITRASLTTIQQLQTAQTEQEIDLRTQELQARLAALKAETSAGPTPTDDMREYNLYVEQAEAAGQAPVPFLEYQTQLRKSGATTIDFNQNQGNAAGYADRMVNADAIISDPKVAQAMMDLQQMATDVGTPLGLGNFLVTPEYQQADQAMRDFINAILRKESGATIRDEEFASARKQYFPLPGDSEAVIKQKADNRRIAIEGVMRSAGPSYTAPSLSPGGETIVDAEDFFD